MKSRTNDVMLDNNSQVKSQQWARSPYGLRLGADPATLFQTMSEALNFVVEGDRAHAMDENTKQTLDKWKKSLNTMVASSSNPSSDEDRMELAAGEVFYTKQGYTDTSVGGNDVINPYWQFNIDDDIVPISLAHTTSVGSQKKGISGMGRVYSEMYDDTQQVLWVGAGVPLFTNVATFFANAGNSEAADLMNMGKRASLVGRLLIYARNFTWWAITFPITAPINLVRWCAKWDSQQITKYYTFRPTQTLYYELVNTMLSYLAVGMGLYPQIAFASRRPPDKQAGLKASQALSDKEIEDRLPEEASSEQKDALRKLLKTTPAETGIPELLHGGPDIFKIMNKRIEQFGVAKSSYYTREIQQTLYRLAADPSSTDMPVDMLAIDNRRARTEALTSEAAQIKWREDIAAKINKIAGDPKLNDDEKQFQIEQLKKIAEGNRGENSLLSTAWESLKGSVLGIGDYVGFRVEKSIGNSEDLSNSTGPTGLAEQINGVASSARDARIDAAGSKWLSRLVNVAQGDWKTMLARLAGDLSGGPISVITNGNGLLDIPDVWKNSSFNKNYGFSISLRARYGDPVSIYQSIYIPLCMWLGLAAPRAVGDTMYTSPFLIRAYCKGMFAIPCGIVDSLSITRGASEYGWSEGHLPLSVDLRISIKDLSPTFFLSMQDIGLFDTFSRNENMMEYLDTLSGLGIVEKSYGIPRYMRKITAALLIKKNTIFSSTYWSQRTGRSPMLRAAGQVVPILDFESTKPGYNTL